MVQFCRGIIPYEDYEGDSLVIKNFKGKNRNLRINGFKHKNISESELTGIYWSLMSHSGMGEIPRL